MHIHKYLDLLVWLRGMPRGGLDHVPAFNSCRSFSETGGELHVSGNWYLNLDLAKSVATDVE